MTISPVQQSAPAPSTAANSSTDNSLASISSNFQQFLTLLTTQLQNQDPTNPMDTNAMTSEIAQLSMVQAQNVTNSTLQNLLTAFNTTQTSSVVGYIGKMVQSSGDTSVLQGGTAEFAYNLPSSAASATISIQDSSGNTVYTGNAPTDSGQNIAFWNGINSITGAQEPDGAYKFTITAKDATGNAIAATTSSTGVVTAVDIGSDGSPTLDFGGFLSVPLANVKSVGADPFSAISGTGNGSGRSTSTTNSSTGTNG